MIIYFKWDKDLVFKLEKSKEWNGKGREKKTETKLGYPAVKPVITYVVNPCKEICIFKISIPGQPT